MKAENYTTVEFPSRSANESYARTVAACFAARLDPTLDEINETLRRKEQEMGLSIRIQREDIFNAMHRI